MKKIFLSLIVSALCIISGAQNVGIGTTTPGFPLNFSNALGDKISLYGNIGNHYGFGIQGGLLQMHSDAAAANISFGYGSSAAFTERMRIINSGGDGLSLSGRITLRNGTNPLDINYGSGVWMYKADNSSLLGFMGVQNNQNMGFYGGPAGWGFTYDAVNSRVGIGNNSPNAPLAFPPSLGKKITLYPGATGDVGFGVAGNRLQIYSDNPNADVAIGYDAAGTFNERFAFKSSGAFSVNGNSGTAKQVLISNGNSSTPVWVSMGDIIETYSSSQPESLLLTGTNSIELPAPLTVSVSIPSRIIVYLKTETWKLCVVGTCHFKWELKTYLNGVFVSAYSVDGITFAAAPAFESDATLGPDFIDVPAGTHTITFTGTNSFNEPNVNLKVCAIVIPQ